MRRIAASATILGGLCWLGWGLSIIGIALKLPPVPFSIEALFAAQLFLGLGMVGLLLGGNAPGGRAGRIGAAATALGGLFAVISFPGDPISFSIGLWLILAGTVAVGLGVRHHRTDPHSLIAGTALAGAAIVLSLIAVLSSRGPIGLFGLSYDVNGLSTWNRVIALVQVVLGSAWAWLGWRVFNGSPPAPTVDHRASAERRRILGVVGLALVVALLVGAGLYWVGPTSGPARPVGTPVSARFEGIGGQETASFALSAGKLRFDWDVRACGAVGAHEVVSVLLKRLYDADHTPDPGPPWFLGGGGPRTLLSPTILGQEYGAGGPIVGSKIMDVESGLWDLNVELPDQCHWAVAITSA